MAKRADHFIVTLLEICEIGTHISDAEFQELQRCFLLIQEPFKKRTQGRPYRFFPYSYVCSQLVRQIGRADLCDMFGKPVRPHRWDELWEGICHDLGWGYTGR